MSQFAVECADLYLGEWRTPSSDDAEEHAKKLDESCSCGGPHRVLMNEWVDLDV